MPAPAMLVWGVAFPVAFALLAWGGWWTMVRHSSETRVAGAIAALPVVCGFLLAFFAADPFAKFPPLLAVDWLFYSALGLGGVAVAEALFRPARHWQRLLLWVVAAGLIVIPVTTAWRNGLDADFNPRSPGMAWMAVAGWCAGVVIVRVAVGRLGCAAPMWGVWLLGLTSAVAAVVLGLSGSQFAMPFRSASLGLALLPLLVVMLAERWRGNTLPLPAPALTGWAMIFGGVILAGYLWYTLTAVNALLLAAGPLVAAALPGKWGWPRLAAGLLPVLAALTLALIAFAKAQSADPYGYQVAADVRPGCIGA